MIKKNNLKLNYLYLIELLMFLLVINYMIVTIILRDFALAKYLRDILLIVLFFISIGGSRLKIYPQYEFVCLFVIFLLFGFAKAENLYLAVQETRRLLFPIVVYIIMVNSCRKEWIKAFCHFCLYFFSIISVWGIFQAIVLKDKFLMKLGYPTRYAREYGGIKLNYSYYFGNLGIQRVVATLSSSNVCALILGCSLIFLVMNYEMIKGIKGKNVLLLCISFGYLLTFSRSNFVSAVVVVSFFAWKYIPYKKELVLFGILLVIGILALGIFQGNGSLVYKILNWVGQSLQFKESSSAGRLQIWGEAFNAVKNHPFGVGMGHVGENSYLGKASFTYACENSYFALALDVGLPGMLLYFAFLLYLAYSFNKKSKSLARMNYKDEARIGKCGMILIVYTMISMLFSNYVLDMEAMTIIYIYISFSLISIRLSNEIKRSKMKWIQ